MKKLMSIGVLLGVILASQSVAAQYVCGPQNVVCANYNTHQLGSFFAIVEAGETVEVMTDNLQPIEFGPGGFVSEPDPMVVVAYRGQTPLSSLTPGTPSTHTLEILAYSDDGLNNPPNSELIFTAPYDGTYQVFLFSRGTAAAGRADLHIIRSGGPPQSHQEVVFGTNYQPRHAKFGDTFLLGKSPDPEAPRDPSEPAFDDTQLLVLEMGDDDLTGGSCMEECSHPAECQGYCTEKAWWSNDDIGPLSRVDLVNGGSTEAGGTTDENVIVLSGGFMSADTLMTSRLMHLRKHYNQGGLWTHTLAQDADGDKLTAEVEEDLNTCDGPYYGSAVTWVYKDDTKWSCGAFRDFINEGQDCETSDFCWHPSDSDHDGMSDFEEAYGARRCFQSGPRTPLNLLDSVCEDADGNGWCDNDCSDAEFAVTVPVSLMDSGFNDGWRPPDPHVYDIMLDLHSIQTYTGSTPPLSSAARDTMLTEAQLASLIWAIEEEPLECEKCARDGGPDPSSLDFAPAGQTCSDPSVYCPEDSRYQARLHVFHESHEMPYVTGDDGRNPGPALLEPAQTMSIGGSRSLGGALWNTWVDVDRRHSGLFRGGFLVNFQGSGQAIRPGARFVVGDNANSTLHELGHLLDLYHGGDDVLTRHVVYPSSMNYGTANTMKVPQWTVQSLECDTTTFPNCPEAWQDCVIDIGPNLEDLCLPRCAPDNPEDQPWPIRFSRGTYDFTLMEEAAGNDETDLPEYFATEFGCMNHGNKVQRASRYTDLDNLQTQRVSCGSTTCDIDLDQDDAFETSNDAFDLNHGDFDSEVSVHEDHDDWARIFRYGNSGIRWELASGQDQPRGEFKAVLFYSAFDAPESAMASDGTCGSQCQSLRNAENVLPFETPVEEQGVVSYPTGPVNGVARLSGGHLILRANPTIDSIVTDSKAWSFRLWGTLKREIKPGDFFEIANSRLFRLWGTRTQTGGYAFLISVRDGPTGEIRTTPILESSWAVNDWILFHVAFRPYDLGSGLEGELQFGVSHPVDMADLKSRAMHAQQWFALADLEIAFPESWLESAGGIGDIVVGAGPTYAGFGGDVDDLTFSAHPDFME